MRTGEVARIVAAGYHRLAHRLRCRVAAPTPRHTSCATRPPLPAASGRTAHGSRARRCVRRTLRCPRTTCRPTATRRVTRPTLPAVRSTQVCCLSSHAERVRFANEAAPPGRVASARLALRMADVGPAGIQQHDAQGPRVARYLGTPWSVGDGLVGQGIPPRRTALAASSTGMDTLCRGRMHGCASSRCVCTRRTPR